MALKPLGAVGFGQTVWRCNGECSEWNPADGDRPQDHGRFAVDDGATDVVCPECRGLATRQTANPSNDDRSDNYVDATPVLLGYSGPKSADAYNGP